MASKLKAVRHQDGTAYGQRFWCPGCADSHTVTTAGDKAWGYNGDPERPTFTPSILVYGLRVPASETYNGVEYVRPRCHSFVRDGHIEYLSDCEHAMASKRVPLPDWDDAHASSA